MRVLLDTNILLDVLLDRAPWVEDNVQIACASISGLDAIVTRNKGDFSSSPIDVLTPVELLAKLPSP